MKKIFSALAILFCAGTLVAFSACQPIKDPAELYESFLNKQSYDKNFSSGESLDGMGTIVYRHVSTCEEFFSAVEAKQNIKLIKDVVLSPLEGKENNASIITLSHEYNLYVHLNGFDLTTEKLPDNSGRYYSFLNDGMLTISGEGSTLLSRGIKNNGILNLYDVTVQTNDTNGAAIVNKGALHVKSGTLKTTRNGAICIENYGDVHLQGGTLACASTTDYAITSYGNIEINGGTINATNGGVYVYAGDVFLEDGSVNASNGYALALEAGRATVYGGSLTGKEKDVLLSSMNAQLTVNGGTFANGIYNCGLVTLNVGATISLSDIVNAVGSGATSRGEVFDYRIPM